jgi:hypothetical protein
MNHMPNRVINPPKLLAVSVGVALITIGFLVLIPVEMRNSTAWLGYGVFILVYLANLTNTSLIRLKHEGFDAQIPRLGILWTAYSLYTLLAVGGFFVGVAAQLPVRVLIFYELVLFIGLLAMIRVADFASAKVVEVAASERILASSLDALRTLAAECQIRLARAGRGTGGEYEKFTAILDGIRYLSPSGQSASASLEAEMKSLLLQATDEFAFAQPGVPNPAAQEKLDRCEVLLNLRRQQTRG